MDEEQGTLIEFNSEEEAILGLQQLETNARAMIRLQEDQDFVRLFTQGFVTDWAITQTTNVATYAPERRIRVMEQMLGRSIFKQYCEDVIEKGRQARDTLRQIEEENLTQEEEPQE